MRLSDEQARALVVARRTGSVSNAMLRDVSGLDTLAASNQLRHLRDLELLDLRGKGSATHYVLGPAARTNAPGAAPNAERTHVRDEDRQSHDLRREGQELGLQGHDLGAEGQELGTQGQELPPEIAEQLVTLPRRLPTARLRSLIRRLCLLGAQEAAQLGRWLRRDPAVLVRDHLGPMVRGGELRLLHPDRPNDPRQAYMTAQPMLPGGDADAR